MGVLFCQFQIAWLAVSHSLSILHVTVRKQHQVAAWMRRTEGLAILPWGDLTVRHAAGDKGLDAVIPGRRAVGIVQGVAGEVSHHRRIGGAVGVAD